MARVARHAVAATYELVVEIGADFAGGPKADDPFDTARLREACNLMARLCTRLGLAGDYAITPIRGVTPMVGLAFACASDYRHIVQLWRGDVPGPVHNSVLLDDAIHTCLLEVAGPPDCDRSKRRSKAKEEMASAFSERWT
ncbi:MAG: hypothetical protein JWR80_3924 [Bradyrhizobium sp.]|nr:hypothetical protein [Bradyrhizobium sp.]